MITTVTRQSVDYPQQRRGRNALFPRSEAEEVAKIAICENAADVAVALQSALDSGMRPTVRSGGHCYEDFVVNNPGGMLIDVSKLNAVTAMPDGGAQIGPGAVLGDIYIALHGQAKTNLPIGTCYTVGAGGHISGGGYGVLARQQGLTVDYLNAVDILTVEHNGKVVARHVDRNTDADLFRCLRGGGGANFGVITNFYFGKLPAAPVQISSAGVSFPWETMTEEKFIHIVQTYGHYHQTRGQERETWPLFTMMGLSHKVPNGRLNIGATWNDMDGTNDLRIPTEFLDLFLKCESAEAIEGAAPPEGAPLSRFQLSPCVDGKHRFTTRPWLEETALRQSNAPRGYGTTRGKYKSCYMKVNFTTEEARRMYAWLTRDVPNVNTLCVIAVDNYGGAVNAPHLAHETAVPQRSSIMKLQYQQYWQKPEEDAARFKYFDAMYTDIYSANVTGKHAGTPFHGDHYEGCYINYPDQDMLRYDFWPELYYGTNDLPKLLKKVKKKYDPNNVFHNAMSIRI